MNKMPLIFIGHGSPMNAIETNQYAESWKQLGSSIPRPRAILMISAHWITPGETRISTNEHPGMIYDMGGFPPELYRVQYSAPGSIAIAEEICSVIAKNEAIQVPEHGLLRTSQGQEQNMQVKLDPIRGFDHGVWSILIHLFPAANIPVICMSLDYSSSPESLYHMGEKLALLREQGILIVASGNIVHNLSMMDWSGTIRYPWTQEFDSRIAEGIQSGKNSEEFMDILEFQSWGDISRLAHPSYDHLLPLFPLLGAVSIDDPVSFLTPEISMGSLSMRSIVWG